MERLPLNRLWARGWDALVDANPVLARELFVTARTPVFIGSIAAAPLLLGGLVVLVRLAMGDEMYSVPGRELFPVYFVGLALVLGTLGGALGSTLVAQEREGGTLDALKFSALSPRTIVLGKFAAVVFAQAAVAICTLPLLAFVLSTGGVSLADALVAMGFAGAYGLMTASLGIAVSAHLTHTRRSLLVSLLGSGVLALGVMPWLALAAELGPMYRGPFGVARAYGEAPWTGMYVTVLWAIPACLVTCVLWLGYALATAGLTDPAEDRSLPIKRWAVGALATGMAALAVCEAMTHEWLRALAARTSMMATAGVVVALLFAFTADPVRPTRRMLAHPPSRLARIFLPSCLAPSVLFAVVAGGIVLLSIPLLAPDSSKLEVDALWAVLFLSALGGFLGTVAARRGRMRARVFGGIAVVGLTFLVSTLRADSPGVMWVDAICPLWVAGVHATDAERMLGWSLGGWAAAAVGAIGMMVWAVRASSRRAPT